MKKIKIVKSKPIKEKEEVIDQLPQDNAPEADEVTFESNPLEFILQKYPSLNDTLVELLTEDFRDYITGVYVMAPKPTIFKIVLHNNRFFHLIYLGDNIYQAKVSGKKYYLKRVNELEYAVIAIADLLTMGAPPQAKGPEAELASAPEETPTEETPETGGEEEEAPEELTESKIDMRIRINEAEVSGQDAETLGVALWNASIANRLPKELNGYKDMYKAMSKYTSKYKVPIEKFSGQRITTSDFWKEETGKAADEPKTDLKSVGSDKLRLSAKKGAAQLMSAERKEAKATVLAAARTAKLEKATITTLMKLINDLATATKTDKLNTGDLKKANAKELKSKVNIEAKKVIDKADKVQKQLEAELSKLFNSNPEFRNAFAYEAMTGADKFADVRGKANFVIAFNNNFTDVKLEDISKVSSPMVKKIAEKCKVSVAFKSSSYKIKGEKAGYTFFSALRLGLEDLLGKEQKLKEILEKKNLNEETVLDKVRQFFTYLYNKFNQLVDYISKGLEKVKELIEQGLDAVLDFLGVDIDVTFDNNIDFYSAS